MFSLVLACSCNGAIVSDADGAEILQMSGDQRTNIHEFLVDQEICAAGQVGNGWRLAELHLQAGWQILLVKQRMVITWRTAHAIAQGSVQHIGEDMASTS